MLGKGNKEPVWQCSNQRCVVVCHRVVAEKGRTRWCVGCGGGGMVYVVRVCVCGWGNGVTVCVAKGGR